MAQRFPSVALIGATGNIGSPILKALSEAQPRFKAVTVLSRSGAAILSSLPFNVTVKAVDYSSRESLIAALTGIDAVVSAIASRYTASQADIIDAAAEAGVRFFIPSEFGLASNLPQLYPDFPIFAPKVRIQQKLARLREEGKMDYTLVFVGLFSDKTGLGGFLIDLKNKKQEVWDGGEHPISLTSTASIAKAIVAVLEGKAAGKTEVRVKDINISQRRLFELCAEVVGKDGWEVTHLDTAEATRVARQTLLEGTAQPVDHYAFVKRGAAVEGFGIPWASEEEDSEALGLRQWTEGDMLEFINRVAESPEK